MNFANPETWQDGISAVVHAPHIVVPLLLFVAGAAWWLRGTIERAARGGLKAQIGALGERLQLAHDQHAAVTSKLDEAKLAITSLGQTRDRGRSEISADAIADVARSIQTTVSANAALAYVLRPKPDSYLKHWQDHARMAAMMQKIAFIVDYEDGRTARFYVSQWDVASGDDVVRIIAAERQREGSLPQGTISGFKRETIEY